MRLSMPHLALLLSVACTTAQPSEIDPDLSRVPGESLVLTVGEQRIVDGIVTVGFQSVDEDSRCPVDVQCVQAGNAAITVTIAIGKGPTVPIRLNTGHEPRSGVAGIRVTLISVTPKPISTQTIDPRSYRAELRLSPAQ